jgi:hypothetical protein
MVLGVTEREPVPPVLLVEHVEQRNRLTVAFRLLLLLPQVIVFFVLGLVAGILVVVGWFAALVLGRLPEPIAKYLCQFIGYTTRLYAYALLLTDRYPPFGFSAGDYPVKVELAPGRLNRLAVLFRLFLAIPATVISGVVLLGWQVASFVIWLVVLVAGRVPGPLFDATTAILRYNMRYNAYNSLVTAAYPWGLFGDRPAPPGPSETVGGPFPGEAYAQAPWSPAAPAGPAVEMPPPPGTPAGLLVLSTPARRLVVLFVVLGAVAYGVNSAVAAVTAGGTAAKAEALSALTAAQDTLNGRTREFQEKTGSCRSTADALSCVEAADRELADAFDGFAGDVDSVNFPTAKAEAVEVEQVARDLADALRQAAAATTEADYGRRAADLGPLGTSLDQKYEALVRALTS